MVELSHTFITAVVCIHVEGYKDGPSLVIDKQSDLRSFVHVRQHGIFKAAAVVDLPKRH